MSDRVEDTSSASHSILRTPDVSLCVPFRRATACLLRRMMSSCPTALSSSLAWNFATCSTFRARAFRPTFSCRVAVAQQPSTARTGRHVSWGGIKGKISGSTGIKRNRWPDGRDFQLGSLPDPYSGSLSFLCSFRSFFTTPSGGRASNTLSKARTSFLRRRRV